MNRDESAVRMDEAQAETPPLRADARRNREQIIEAARALFVRVGPTVPMEEVARTAGVGVATLYRRFPDRDSLIEAVGHHSMTRLAERARQVERDEPDPALALAALLRSALDLRMGIILSTVSARTYRALRSSPVISEQRDEVMGIATRLLERAQAGGAIRPDVGLGDALLALTLVSHVVTAPGDELMDLAFERLFSLVMDGLRGQRGSLPGRPLDDADVEELSRRGVATGRRRPDRDDTASG